MDGTDEESQEHREKRIAQLWSNLDVSGRGELDFNGLRKGLKKIDHR
jgi:solute carrier family 25 (mitochondrial phosphate transporter), member 23/24/25/41